ncbi:Asp23/Gls24 family envelope stress response protein [Micromonospora sp. WMMD1102]|uniref:Asp23/Gls24 family envelope stress response protein n=1 Tax=Micromonospora sp. WMMD1102 TaxID=3016105 RepID=UPI002414E286|nr:Asp23/Gls24 family envelope stress response protein [Micromonospora sp. WMMD1102]MDG4789548.1 Asp23/Gls24 family envelope stress response protein [Micromonospora sp. WMMD1102]
MTEVQNDSGQAPETAPAAPAPAAAPRGGTEVSEEVIEKIAGTAARSVPGVADLGGDVARFFNTVLDKVGLDEVGDAGRGVSAEVKGTSATIRIVLVIAAGHVVQEVTEAVRASVIEAVEKYGLTVTEVNVKVDDIELNAPPAAGA